MTTPEGGYLPPVVVQILADAGDALAKIAEVKAELASLQDAVITIKAVADTSAAASQIAATRAAAQAPVEIPVHLDTNMAELLALNEALAELGRVSDGLTPLTAFNAELAQEAAVLAQFRDLAERPIEIPVHVTDTAAAFAKVEALRHLGGATDVLPGSVGGYPSVNLMPGGEGGGFAGTAAGITAMGVAAERAKPSLLSLLGWGGSARIPFTGLSVTFAKFGSVLGLAGLSLEHFATTALGLAASGVGAALGGMAVGITSLTTAGVGMMTDMAGIGQAYNDIKLVVQAQNQLKQAVAVYGKGSIEATHAQAQLNQTLKSFSPVARGAVLHAANVAQQFETLFDKATGLAEKRGAKILTQLMKVGEGFLPIIGQFAARNMSIIQRGIQPLLTWISGPGKSIFVDIENKFSQDLPTAVHAFTQAFELFGKTVDHLLPNVGRFLTTIDNWLTKMNGAGFDIWIHRIDTLVGLFRTWEAFVKILVQDIIALFGESVGVGTTIIQTLTQMLTKLHTWIESTQGKTMLSGLFQAHAAEIKNLLMLLPPLISAFGRLYLILAPGLTMTLATVLRVVDDLLHLPFVGTIMAWGLAVGFLWSRLKLLQAFGAVSSIFKGVIGGVSGIRTAIGAIGDFGATTMAGERVAGTGLTAAEAFAATPAVAGLSRPIGILERLGGAFGATGTAAVGMGAAVTAGAAAAVAAIVAFGIKAHNTDLKVGAAFNTFVGVVSMATNLNQVTDAASNQIAVIERAAGSWGGLAGIFSGAQQKISAINVSTAALTATVKTMAAQLGVGRNAILGLSLASGSGLQTAAANLAKALGKGPGTLGKIGIGARFATGPGGPFSFLGGPVVGAFTKFGNWFSRGGLDTHPAVAAMNAYAVQVRLAQAQQNSWLRSMSAPKVVHFSGSLLRLDKQVGFLASRVKTSSQAFDVYGNAVARLTTPFHNVLSTSIQYHNGLRGLRQQLSSNTAGIKGWGQAATDNKTALASLFDTVNQKGVAAFQKYLSSETAAQQKTPYGIQKAAEYAQKIETRLIPAIKNIATQNHISGRSFDALAGRLTAITQGKIPSIVKAFEKASSGTKSAVTQMASNTKTQLAQMATQNLAGGTQAGAAIPQGMLIGINNNSGPVFAAAQALGAQAVASAKAGAGAHSPSVPMIKLGHDVIAGLILGLKDKTASVLAVAQQLGLDLTRQLAHAVTPSALETSLNSFMSRLQDHLASMQSKLKSVVQSMHSDIRSLASTISGTDLSSLFGTDAAGNPTVGNVGGYLSLVAAQVGAFVKDLKAMAAAHVAPGLIQLIANLGPVQGDRLAKQVLSGQAGSIAGLDATFKQINVLSRAGATTVETPLYAHRIRKAEENQREAVQRLRAIEHILSRMEKMGGGHGFKVDLNVHGGRLKLTHTDAVDILEALHKVQRTRGISASRRVATS